MDISPRVDAHIQIKADTYGHLQARKKTDGLGSMGRVIETMAEREVELTRRVRELESMLAIA